MSPQPGEVWLADLGLAAKTRPVIVVSRFDPDPLRALFDGAREPDAAGWTPSFPMGCRHVVSLYQSGEWQR